MSTILGWDIGGTKCAVLLARASNGLEILRREELETRASEGFSQIWERLLEATDEMLADEGFAGAAPRRKLAAIGVSCGGPLNARTGVVHAPPNLPGWDDIPVTDLLRARYGVPAHLQNDANACALAEWQLGAGRGCENMLFLTMGTGFGCGAILGGRLATGANDMLGEIGHMRLEDDGPVGYGKAGSIEGFCSGAGIGKLMARETERMERAGHAPAWVREGIAREEYGARLLARYAARGDGDALALWALVGDKLGKACAALIDAFNPERIVIGSIFVRCERWLRPTMEAAIVREALGRSAEACRVVPARLGEAIGDCACAMAALYAMDRLPLPGAMTPGVRRHLERMLERYPDLAPTREDVERAYWAIDGCYRRGGKLLVCGNGGSAADAEHIVGELMKGFLLPRAPQGEARRAALHALGEDGLKLQMGLPAIALDAHTALNSAILNDVDGGLGYAQQVLGYGRRGDVLLCISTSGNARNAVYAAKLADALGMRTIALTGRGDSALSEVCEICIRCPGEGTAQVQERHLPVYHGLCAMVEEAMWGEKEPV